MYIPSKKSVIAVFIFACFATGCVRQILPNNFELEGRDGVVLFTASCGSGIGSFFMYPSGFNPNMLTDFKASAKIQFCPSTPELRSYSMPAGKHFIGNLYAAGDTYEFPENEAHVFTVSPGEITYIGDIRINTETAGTTIFFNIAVSDLEDQTLTDAKKQFPKLFNRYKYKKRLIEKD